MRPGAATAAQAVAAASAPAIRLRTAPPLRSCDDTPHARPAGTACPDGSARPRLPPARGTRTWHRLCGLGASSSCCGRRHGAASASAGAGQDPSAVGQQADGHRVGVGRGGADLGHGRDPAGTVGASSHVDDGVDGSRELGPDRAQGRPTPASRTRVSSRRRASAGPLACTVARQPAWPVLRAWSRSRASPPRTSPTISRSGRRRRALRTRSRRATSPMPSALGGRASRRTTWGWGSRSSAASSTVTTRSPAGAHPASALSSVVLPAPVPPATTRFQPAVTASASSSATGSAHQAASGSGRTEKRRTARQGPSTDTGATTAWTRDPSGRRASTTGLDRSTRRPRGVTIRSISSSTSDRLSRRPVATSAPCRSTHTDPSPFTSRSVTAGSPATPLSGPRSTGPGTASAASVMPPSRSTAADRAPARRPTRRGRPVPRRRPAAGSAGEEPEAAPRALHRRRRVGREEPWPAPRAPQGTGESPGEGGAEEAGVGAACHGWVPRHDGHDGYAQRGLDVGRAKGPLGLFDQHHPTRPKRCRHGPAQRQEAGPEDQQWRAGCHGQVDGHTAPGPAADQARVHDHSTAPGQRRRQRRAGLGGQVASPLGTRRSP